jgi:hypothetical protein
LDDWGLLLILSSEFFCPSEDIHDQLMPHWFFRSSFWLVHSRHLPSRAASPTRILPISWNCNRSVALFSSSAPLKGLMSLLLNSLSTRKGFTPKEYRKKIDVSSLLLSYVTQLKEQDILGCIRNVPPLFS